MALIKSNKSGVICAKCDNLITIGTYRNVSNGMHEHYSCPRFVSLRSDDSQEGCLDWLMDEFKTSKELSNG